ncbi:MAG TPA: HlyC/CorC family transporter [Dehalococcoidia bacterium]|nr:HlyC/CorC family transporter [Dehalococcoidia bacterium]
MTNADVVYLVLFFLCLLLSGFFSSSEVAFISLQKLRLRHLANTEGGAAKEVAIMTEKPERLLTTILLGNNLVNTAAAALATIIVASVLASKGQAVIVSTAGVTILLLIFGEVFPKTAATRYGERMALLYAKPMQVLIWILFPIATVFVWLADKLARAVGAAPAPQALVSEDEIRTAVSVGAEEGTLVEAEAAMVERVFRFGDRQVDEVMTPRPDIIWVEKGTTLSDFFTTFAQSSHSRFPVYEDTIDNVVGILWIKDVLMAQAKGAIQQDSPIDRLARPAYFVPESKPIAELFTELQESRLQQAIVVDEFGGTAGLVTMERLLEEIVGEFGDELARSRKHFETIDENSFQIDGGMRIEDANEKLSLELPEGEYETVAGFVLNVLGRIPKEGDQFKFNNLKLVITEMRGNKVGKILITKE